MNTLSDEQIIARAGTVAVLMGGDSAEREISLISGNAVADALVKLGIDTIRIDWDGKSIAAFSAHDCDRVFIALHGRGGEDGKIQAVMEILGVPYTGSGVLGCALSMDKGISKQIWMQAGIPTPEYQAVSLGYDLDALVAQLPSAVMVKPAREGSSLGVSKVTDMGRLPAALDVAFEYDSVALVERCIEGREFTLSILGREALPIIELKTPHEFYDFDAKYLADTTEYLCPCDLSAPQAEKCMRLGLTAFDALNAHGWARLDFMLDDEGQPWFIELNTVPGLTDHSLVPMAAAKRGISFESLIARILATSFEPADR